MIKKAERNDSQILAELAIKMWSDSTFDDLESDFAQTIADKNAICFLKYAEGIPAGFAQCQLRYDYVEGTQTSPVGYLEGIFIEPSFRQMGFAKELLKACESWAKEKGCSEFASDCELDNTDSFIFHMSTGFEEANRIICFRKTL